MADPLAHLLFVKVNEELQSLSYADRIAVLRGLLADTVCYLPEQLLDPFREPRPNSVSNMPNIAERSGALQAAEREVGTKLTATQKSCARLLDPVREIDWHTKNGQVVSKDLRTQCNRDAFLLQRRGEEQEDRCTSCANGRGPFRSCVAAPDVRDSDGKERSLYAGSCANCVWQGHAADCSFYLGKAGAWKSDLDLLFLQQGGLRALYDDQLVVREWPADPSEAPKLKTKETLPVVEASPEPLVTPQKVPQVVVVDSSEKGDGSPGVVTRSRGKLSTFFRRPEFARPESPVSKSGDGTPSSSKTAKSKMIDPYDVDLRPFGYFRADAFGVVSFKHHRTPTAPSASPSVLSAENRKKRGSSTSVQGTPSKRRKIDGAVLPWPISRGMFENLDELSLARADLRTFLGRIDAQIALLEAKKAEEERKRREEEARLIALAEAKAVAEEEECNSEDLFWDDVAATNPVEEVADDGLADL